METVTMLLVVFVFLTVLLLSMCISLNKDKDELDKRHDKRESDLKNKINELKEQIDNLEKENLNSKIDKLSLLLTDQDYNKIKAGTKFILLSGFSNKEPIHVNRVLIQLPDNKYQLVMVDIEGAVLGGTKMGVVDTLDEVIAYIKQYPYAVVEY